MFEIEKFNNKIKGSGFRVRPWGGSPLDYV